MGSWEPEREMAGDPPLILLGISRNGSAEKRNGWWFLGLYFMQSTC